MAKLTLSVDDEVVLRAKEFAKVHGTSVSEMVETYLNSVSHDSRGDGQPSLLLDSIRGILKEADLKDYRGQYRDHLAAKHL